jgi:hypothetical protein
VAPIVRVLPVFALLHVLRLLRGGDAVLRNVPARPLSGPVRRARRRG